MMQAQCWICPYCFDDHAREGACKVEDLKQVIDRERNAHEAMKELAWNLDDYTVHTRNRCEYGNCTCGLKEFREKLPTLKTDKEIPLYESHKL